MSTDPPNKPELHSRNITDDRAQELLHLFPEIRTDCDKLDFERMKLARGETIYVAKERYGMNWPGKDDRFKTIQNTSLGMLLPGPKESVNFENTENFSPRKA
jgi:adenine-specific DNA-methyltransferase